MNGKWVKTNHSLSNFDNSVTNSAKKKLQRQVLEKGLDALENTSIEERKTSSMTMNIDPKNMKMAKNLIDEFMTDLCKFLEAGNQKRVYHFGVNLYPIEKKEN